MEGPDQLREDVIMEAYSRRLAAAGIATWEDVIDGHTRELKTWAQIREEWGFKASAQKAKLEYEHMRNTREMKEMLEEARRNKLVHTSYREWLECTGARRFATDGSKHRDGRTAFGIWSGARLLRGRSWTRRCTRCSERCCGCIRAHRMLPK